MSQTIIVTLERSQDEGILSFTTNMSLPQFNCFRRIIVCEIPTVVIDLVEMIDNSSIMCDEVLVGRISQIPLIYNKHEELLRKDLCDCDLVCEKCSFMIKFKGKTGGWLMSNDISPIMLKNIPIVYLSNTHKVRFNAICTRGVASWHSKWNLGVVVSMNVIRKGLINVTLTNTGTYSYDYILREAFSIMKSKLDIDIEVH